MELPYLDFDKSAAKAYRKTSQVLAFRSDDAFVFHKPWGIQHLPEGSWVIVPLDDGRPTGDIYGCHREAFVTTYRLADSGQPHTYEKHAVVYAYQPGEPFAVKTVVAEFNETDPATGGATDWLVLNPGGEIYIINDLVFRSTYQLAQEEISSG
jgi:hypothetical protein